MNHSPSNIDLEALKSGTERLLRRVGAAKYLAETYGINISPKTLAKWACVSSDGPAFRKAGRIPLYPVSSLDSWAQSRLGPLVRSTSEADSGVTS
jgi:hypothetical protein